jgi:hypothetical protein
MPDSSPASFLPDEGAYSFVPAESAGPPAPVRRGRAGGTRARKTPVKVRADGDPGKAAGHGHGDDADIVMFPERPASGARDLAAMVREGCLTKEEGLAVLSAIVRTPAGEIDENHFLAQEIRETSTGRTVKMPGKLEALRTLGDWLRWDADKEKEAAREGALSVAAQIAAIRARRPMIMR